MVDRTKNILDGALATTRGWLDLKTGELLVSIRGLSGAVEWTKELVADIKAGGGVAMDTLADIKDEVVEAVEEIKEIVADKDTKGKKTKKVTKAAE